MKLLVTGAAGMFGEAVKKVFKDDDLILTDKYQLDVRNYNAVMGYAERLNIRPDYILHLAAETDLEVCECRPERAYHINTTGTFNAVKLAKFLHCPIIYMSTAGVFPGYGATGYDETYTPHPINHYGRSKYYGELAVQEYEKYYIFRMSWAMGGGPKMDKKFVNKIYKLIKRGDKVLYAIADLYGSPTYTHDVAKTIRNALREKTPYGIYHVAGKGRASRYDVARAIVEILKADVDVVLVGRDHFNKNYFCPRAINEELITVRPNNFSVMRDWRDSLEDYLRLYYYD